MGRPVTKTEKKEIVIDNITSFREWVKAQRKFRFQNETSLYRFKLTEFTDDENTRISKKVNEYTNACGCKSGSLLMNVVFALTVACYFILGGRFSTITLSHVLWCAGITLSAAFAGKLAGLLQARWNLIQFSNNLSLRVNAIHSVR